MNHHQKRTIESGIRQLRYQVHEQLTAFKSAKIGERFPSSFLESLLDRLVMMEDRLERQPISGGEVGGLNPHDAEAICGALEASSPTLSSDHSGQG